MYVVRKIDDGETPDRHRYFFYGGSITGNKSNCENGGNESQEKRRRRKERREEKRSENEDSITHETRRIVRIAACFTT